MNEQNEYIIWQEALAKNDPKTIWNAALQLAADIIIDTASRHTSDQVFDFADDITMTILTLKQKA